MGFFLVRMERTLGSAWLLTQKTHGLWLGHLGHSEPLSVASGSRTDCVALQPHQRGSGEAVQSVKHVQALRRGVPEGGGLQLRGERGRGRLEAVGEERHPGGSGWVRGRAWQSSLHLKGSR